MYKVYIDTCVCASVNNNAVIVGLIAHISNLTRSLSKNNYNNNNNWDIV